MKKRWLLIVLLVSAVLTSMVEGSSAIYTWSQTFNFNMTFAEKEPDYPILPDDFRKYEMKGILKTSKVDFDLERNEIDIQGEAGAFRCFKNSAIPKNDRNYSVHARITELDPMELKNLGVTFLSSHADNGGGDDTYLSAGYILKFDQAGDLYIEAQKISHSGEDSYGKYENGKESHKVLSAAEIKQKLGNIDFNRSLYVDIYVQKRVEWAEEHYVSVYINKVLMNAEPIVLLRDYFSDQTDVEGKNISIGVSSYQTRDANGNIIENPLRHVKVNELYLEHWDQKPPY